MELVKNSRTMERLLNENEVIELLGLKNRRNPKGALRWLMRLGKLGSVRLGRGIYGFKVADIEALIESSYVSKCRGN